MIPPRRLPPALLLLSLAGSAAVLPAAPDEKEKKAAKLDINATPENARRVEFTTDEGTWMSVDVSPDGATILFDLLRDIYRMPIKGGKAERITSRPAYDSAPTRSPSEPKLTE